MRPRVHVYIAVSLDGFIAREDGALDWLEPMQVDGEDYGYPSFFAGVDALVLGRSTYDIGLTFDPWPYAGKQVVVLTHRALSPRHGETTHQGSLQPLVRQLAQAGVRAVYLDGGQAVRQGLQEQVVDEMTLNIVPVLLGRGRPLFGPEVPASAWRLAQTRAYATGLVQSRYLRQP